MRNASVASGGCSESDPINGFVNRRSTVRFCPPARSSKTKESVGLGAEPIGPSKWDKRREREGLPKRKDLIRSNPGYRRTYNTWVAMNQRCRDPRSAKFPWYGGKGIAVCQRWLDFDLFMADMGERPDGKTLDRIDGEKDYEPGNCRWADSFEQARNREDYRGKSQRRRINAEVRP